MNTIDLTETYVAINNNNATAVPGGPAFWEQLESGGNVGADLEHGWLVGTYCYTGPWDHWEMHPEGDEIVHIVLGHLDFTIDDGTTTHTLHVATGQSVVVPAGTWHTADTTTPTQALHITYGQGTLSRER